MMVDIDELILTEVAPQTGRPWGEELVLDLQGCDHAKITDPDLIGRFSAELCEFINMSAYGKPLTPRFAVDDPANPYAGGITLVQRLIEESDIVVHFIEHPDLDAACVNVFTRKLPFNAAGAATFIQNYFGGTVIRAGVRARGPLLPERK